MSSTFKTVEEAVEFVTTCLENKDQNEHDETITIVLCQLPHYEDGNVTDEEVLNELNPADVWQN